MRVTIIKAFVGLSILLAFVISAVAFVFPGDSGDSPASVAVAAAVIDAAVEAAEADFDLPVDRYEGIAPLGECEGTRKDDLYAGLAADNSLLVMPEEYFVSYSESRGRSFIPSAVHIYGEVLIRSETCDLLQLDPHSSEDALYALDLLAHEVAHAIDYNTGRELSDSAAFPHVDVGHSQVVNHAERELLAFCMQRIAMGEDLRRRCPNSNYVVTTGVLRKVLGFEPSELRLDY